MKALKVRLGGLLILAAFLIVPLQSMAQWSIGASYEIRDQDPKNGFGLRLERSLLGKLPIFDLGLRAHFSYFNDENDFSSGGATVSRKITYYDYGLAATGGFSLGLLKPYVGLGIGNNTFDIEDDDSESEFFWNSFIGAELTPIPKLHPFIEYRFQPTDSPEFAEDFDSDGRLIFGLSLSF